MSDKGLDDKDNDISVEQYLGGKKNGQNRNTKSAHKLVVKSVITAENLKQSLKETYRNLNAYSDDGRKDLKYNVKYEKPLNPNGPF